eukprot:GEZU01020551.1.p1 GENE.GEZU01020551.1~~GEZU01020551.1.p1  ORF type:complete len:1614 (-),score=413.09 GEZU01020551.1:176-4381(-)
MIKPALPTLTNFLQYEDPKIVEGAIKSFARLAHCLPNVAEKMEALCEYGLIGHLMNSLTSMCEKKQEMNPATFTAIIGLLANLSRASVKLTKNLLVEGIANVLQAVLSEVPGSGAPGTARSPEQVMEILTLVNEILPTINKADSLVTEMDYSRRRALADTTHTPESDVPQRPTSASSPESLAKQKFYEENPELLAGLGERLLPPLMNIFSATVNLNNKYKALNAIGKIIYFSSPETLTQVLRDIPVSTFVTSALSSNDMVVVATAIQLAEMLMSKLPHIFTKYFLREGVVNKMRDLSNKSALQTASSAEEHDEDEEEDEEESTERKREKAKKPILEASSSSPRTPHQTPSKPHVAESPLRSPELLSFVKARAKQFYSKYFEEAESSSSGILVTLRSLAQNLKDRLQDPDEQEEEEILNKVCEVLIDEEGISTFEFLSSGIVGALLDYIKHTDISEESEQTRANRVFMFARLFDRSCRDKRSNADLNNNNVPLASSPLRSIKLNNSEREDSDLTYYTLLVRKLNSALEAEEDLPVIVNESEFSASYFSNNSIRLLSEPFKLNLRQEDAKPGATPSYILVTPLATVGTVEDFLIEKIIPKLSDSEKKKEDKDTQKSHFQQALEAIQQRQQELQLKEKEEQQKDFSAESAKPSEESSTPSNSEQTTTSQDKPSDNDSEEDNDEEDHEDDNDEEHNGTTFELTEELDYDEEEEGEIENPANTREILVAQNNNNAQPQQTADAQAAAPAPSTPGKSIKATASASSSLPKQRPVVELFIGDHRLPKSMNILQALYKYGGIQDASAPITSYSMLRKLWLKPFTVVFKVLTPEEAEKKKEQFAPKKALTYDGCDYAAPTSEAKSIINAILADKLDLDLPMKESAIAVVNLLRILHSISENQEYLPHRALTQKPLVPETEFISTKISAKLTRQLQDPVLVCGNCLPDWCSILVFSCQFLFPFETRKFFFEMTSFGTARTLRKLQERMTQQGGNRHQQIRLVRLDRQKIRLSRDNILESAIKVMEEYGLDKSILEFEYFGEVGTGLGPTREFYTLVSREIQRADLGMWINENAVRTAQSLEGEAASDKYVSAPNGLFPAPLAPNTSQEKVDRLKRLFKFLGRFIARSLLDSRLLDLYLAKPLLKLMRQEELHFHDLGFIKPDLHKQLKQMQDICTKKHQIERDDSIKSEQERKDAIAALSFNGCPIADLALDFVLPGYPHIELKENGANTPVTIWNLEEYIELTTQYYLTKGIQVQMEAFLNGFNDIIPVDRLKAFYVHELEEIICGVMEKWDIKTLMEATKCDHGYSSNSRAVKFLYQIMSEMDVTEQRQFLKFVTGSPKLPMGGIKNLRPVLTIVRKVVDKDKPDAKPDDYLPSVMTCANYLKIPDYSSIEVMRQKLKMAMQDSSFSLS